MPGQPFFLYFATGACHSPHHAPRDWIDRYSGRFDDGWDPLRERAFTRQMAMGLFPAGTLLSTRPDAQVGRVLDFIAALGELDSTLVVAVSDNGASAEGGPTGSINDVRLWNVAMAGNTPFRRWKREVHPGGVADPCIVSWPAGLPVTNGVRRHFAPAIDIVPTILDLIGLDRPKKVAGVEHVSIEGVSLKPVLEDGAAAETHSIQYFEMFGTQNEGRDPDLPYDDVYELYDLGRDPTETEDLAGRKPDRVARMIDPLVARGGEVPGAAARSPAHRGAARPRRGAGRAAGPDLLAGGCGRFRRTGCSACATAATGSPRRWWSRRAAPTACWWPWAPCSGDGACTCSTGGCGTCTTSSGR